MTTAPEPKGKLDAMTVQLDAEAEAARIVNGPEGDVLVMDWEAIDWRAQEDNVRRLRQRIFKATRDGDWAKVRNLQKLMLRSLSNTLVSVRQVTQHNTGRKTPGIDGQVALSPVARVELAQELHRWARPWQARPVKRVYIPKANGKLRGLGIPVILDRVQQARVKAALEPEWEARFEPRSYGFRPGRSCQDAIETIYEAGKGANAARLWVLDADLAAAFDKIDHGRLLTALEGFPAREMIRQWLQAGVVDQGRFAPTEEGTPQGGVISPVLLNVALHGLEEAAGVRYRRLGSNAAWTAAGSPVVVRYADDLLALCHSKEQAEQVKARLAAWLAPRGLVFNEDKTRIVHLDQGCDFLGFNIRRYRGKLLIKPSLAALRRIRQRLGAEMRTLAGAPASAVPHTLNPIVRGWAAYYHSAVSSEAFHATDRHMWGLTYKWAKRRHPNKSKHWIVNRYFGPFNPARRDRWVFGDRDSGSYLRKFSWTRIVRHQMVTGTASPDDPGLAEYWADRRRKAPLPVDRHTRRLLVEQAGCCPLCGDLLLHVDHQPRTPHEWEQWLRVTRMALSKQHIVHSERRGLPDDAVRLVHAHCQRRSVAATVGP